MNILPRDKQIQAISALCEGVSIRATERLTGIHRDTIMRLGARVGVGCARIHDVMMRDLNVPRVELDELWSFVGKKQRRLSRTDDKTKGDQYIFIALAGAAKAIISYSIGKRNADVTQEFVADVRYRVLGAPEISADAFQAYPKAIELAFGIDCTFGTVDKHYRAGVAVDAARRYSPGEVVGVTYRSVVGFPRNISTSYVERQNLTLRMQQRRFTRLTSGYSKKLEHHCAAVALYVGHYNLCRVHEALRVTPAMHLGLTDHVWSIGELIDVALSNPEPRRSPFTVIEGGKA